MPAGEPTLKKRVARKALHLQAVLRHLAASAPSRLAAFAVLALGAKWVTLSTAGYMNDARDGEYFCLYEEVARATIARFHELPLWDPYYCGGLPALGTPSARFASPTLLLTLLFGTIRAEALIGMVMTLVGLEGMYRYARARGGGALGSLLVAPVFALSGFFAKFPTFGWTNFYGFELIPWALFGIRLALWGSRRGVVVVALAVAWMVGFGGTYAAPVTALAAGIELIEALVRQRHRPRGAVHVLAMAGLALVFTAAASLVRLWPVAEMLSASPRILASIDGHAPETLRRFLFGADLELFRGADFLVGIPILPVFIFGGLRRKALPLVFTGLVWVWLAFGYGAKPSLFAVLRLIPPYTMLRAPERFLTLFGVVFAVVAALALRWLEAKARRAPWVLLLWLACVTLTVVDIGLLVENDWIRASERTMVDPPPVALRDFHQARGNRSLALYYPFMSRGSLGCFDDYNVAQSPDLRGDLENEEYLRDEGAGTVERLAWSPNHIQLRVVLSRPARVYVNQNWHPGWHASEGSVVSENGALAVDLPAGEHDLTLRFLPRSGLGGGATSLAALGVAAVALWRSRRRGDAIAPGRPFLRELLLFASPLAFALASFVFVREPRRPPPALVTPVGEPIVADAPPAGAVSVNATWAEGITLVAARILTQPTAVGTEKTATIELDWRLDRKPPTGLGAFVHVDGSPLGFISLDYALLSGALLFEDAPLHRIVRDVSEPITLPWTGRRLTYTVHAGLFRARRNGERLTDVTAPDAHVEDDGSVLVGSFVAP